MNKLTTVAALPMGAGCMASLPAEVNEPKKPEHVLITKWITLEEARAMYSPPNVHLQMKAPPHLRYEEEPHDFLKYPPIDLGEIGGTGA